MLAHSFHTTLAHAHVSTAIPEFTATYHQQTLLIQQLLKLVQQLSQTSVKTKAHAHSTHLPMLFNVDASQTSAVQHAQLKSLSAQWQTFVKMAVCVRPQIAQLLAMVLAHVRQDSRELIVTFQLVMPQLRVMVGVFASQIMGLIRACAFRHSLEPTVKHLHKISN